jgi:small subunit ribosomal protein S18
VENDIPSATAGDDSPKASKPLRKGSTGNKRANRSDGNASTYTTKGEAAKPKRIDEFAMNGTVPDYKNADQLRRFVNQQGKIMPRRRTGLSARNQRLLALAIKRARHLALLAMPGAPRPL